MLKVDFDKGRNWFDWNRSKVRDGYINKDHKGEYNKRTSRGKLAVVGTSNTSSEKRKLNCFRENSVTDRAKIIAGSKNDGDKSEVVDGSVDDKAVFQIVNNDWVSTGCKMCVLLCIVICTKMLLINRLKAGNRIEND